MTAPGQVHSPINKDKTPPYKIAGLVLLVIFAVVVALVWTQFRGGFADPERLTLLSPRSGLSMDPGSKVTYNGVEIGRVVGIDPVETNGEPSAAIKLDVNRKFVSLIPENVVAEIKASTVFGNKYIAFSTPPDPTAGARHQGHADQGAGRHDRVQHAVRDGRRVTKQVDPIKLNQTLTATAQALDGLGEQVRRVARQRQHDPRRAQSADAADSPGQPGPRGPRRRVLRRRTGAVRRPEQRGHHRAYAQRPAEEPRPGIDVRGRIRQHRRRRLRAQRAVPGARHEGPAPDLGDCSTSTAPRCSARSATSTTSSPRPAPRSVVATATR